ncbi:MAG: phosphate ABC transporter permease PstA [Nitrospiraceae bacterium]|jgi:phosphate transport system permease protein|uniref:phosphate ABC transporter permease PstA n=1 Tax=Nitrospira cf. moscoviensis SBR1015 TaxID=96242 RepID=UPI000A0A7824|nr:phosphate ABC transporter permease PstA [Nitrospira cf. moscoviensis SBR1015]MBY0247696.1 phosphate ABC transporter permease PstA [Nitrospiraceae bacterium]OQW35574.1 MAG: phosphate ABC transporter, permease protein PstA [Nitrospira sp. SG-bin2]
MRTQFKQMLATGNVFIWGCAAGVSLSLLMVFGLLLLIMINGLGYFWISDIVDLTLKDGQHVMGQLAGREVIPRSITPDRPEGKSRVRVKIGNRDLSGLDFKWVNDDQIVSQDYPADVVLLERREWGNMYARIQAVYSGEKLLAEGNEAGWTALGPLISSADNLHRQIKQIEQFEIGAINADIERLRLKIRADEMEHPASSVSSEMKAQVADTETRYREKTAELETLRARFDEYSVVMVDANGREKRIAVGQIVRALRPNEMGAWQKSWIYLVNVWAALSTEPREANTEGGIFPAIFGTVMMVIIMSLAVVPFGVLAALYLREYARQGVMVRLVRIAVNNLAGVPSIVFGVFGLGFFIYAIGGTLDTLFFPERLPTPTFGTGGILWASLTLALLTVPVVIVSTEEGLAAVPREFREGSLALGATKLETMLKVVIPSALPGILTGLILAMARAAGEVAPLMLTGVVKLAPALPLDGSWPFFHFDRKFMHLGFHIYDVGFQSPNVEAAKPMVYITTLVLITVVILLNLTAIVLRNHLRKKYAGSVL